MEQGAINQNFIVLVVEDDPLVRLVDVDILEDAGYEVLQASDPREAMSILGHRSDVGVVFTDIQMQGSLDGLALAWVIRERWPQIGLVLTSGGRSIIQSSMPREGLFVQKPYTATTLVRRISDVAPRRLTATNSTPRAISA